MVAIGLVDIMSRRCMKVRESVEEHRSVILSLLSTIALLTKYAELCPQGTDLELINFYLSRRLIKMFFFFLLFNVGPDTTKFLSMVKSSDLFGTISMLYATVVPLGKLCFFY